MQAVKKTPRLRLTGSFPIPTVQNEADTTHEVSETEKTDIELSLQKNQKEQCSDRTPKDSHRRSA